MCLKCKLALNISVNTFSYLKYIPSPSFSFNCLIYVDITSVALENWPGGLCCCRCCIQIAPCPASFKRILAPQKGDQVDLIVTMIPTFVKMLSCTLTRPPDSTRVTTYINNQGVKHGFQIIALVSREQDNQNRDENA